MNIKIKLLLICALMLFETGCWDSKLIQNLAYVTAMGLDHDGGQFITYVQVQNFTNVAKSENFTIGANVPLWIGKGKGKTLTEAMSSIYATSQIRVYWGHVKAIVCSEAILKNKQALHQAYDAINRYREIRYNILLYGTKEPMREIFTQKSILNFSPLDSILGTPEDSFSQRSFIPPQYGYKIIAEINEPGRIAILPSLSIDKEVWTEDLAQKPMFKINGAYIMEERDLSGWFSEDDLKGERWLQKKMKRTLISIPDNKKPVATLVLMRPRHKVQPLIKKNGVSFDVKIKVKAYVDEMLEDISVAKMEADAETAVRNQIIETYQKGLATQTDLLNLSGELYRKYPKIWKQLEQNQKLPLTKDTLNKVTVKVTLIHTGKYKGRVDS